MKKREWILIGAVLVVSAGLWTAFQWDHWFGAQTADYYVEVSVDGQLVQSVPITAEGTYRAAASDSTRENVFVISENGVRMESANCPDKVCVRQGEVEPGTVLPIVCLPNATYVEIVAADERKQASAEGLYQLNPEDYISSMTYDNLTYGETDAVVTEEEFELAKEQYPEEYETRGEEGFMEYLEQVKAAYAEAAVWRELWQQVMDQTEFRAVPEGEQFEGLDEDGRREIAAYRYIAEKESISLDPSEYLVGEAAEYRLFELVLTWLQEHARAR